MLSSMSWFLFFILLIFFLTCLSYSLMSARLQSVLLAVLTHEQVHLQSFQLKLKLRCIIWHIHSVYALCCVCFSWESYTCDLIEICLMTHSLCMCFVLCMLHMRISFPWPAHFNSSWNWDMSDDCAARYIVCMRK
jgi:hypothetical protein